MPRSEPDSGNPTVRDRREAYRNVSRRQKWKQPACSSRVRRGVHEANRFALSQRLRALYFYPDPSVPPFMAVRIMTYLGLLYQDLIRTRCLTVDGGLPPVLPVVLYNGQRRWNAATNVKDLIGEVPGGLGRYPARGALLLDEGRYSDSELAPLRNLVAALFRMENSRSPEAVSQVLENLIAWLTMPEQASVRRAFTVWLKRVFLPGRIPGVEIAEVHDIQEVKTMLAERVKEWTREWERQGMEKGRQEGAAAVLVRQVERKFGAVDEDVRKRIAVAKLQDLQTWTDNILTAATLMRYSGKDK